VEQTGRRTILRDGHLEFGEFFKASTGSFYLNDVDFRLRGIYSIAPFQDKPTQRTQTLTELAPATCSHVPPAGPAVVSSKLRFPAKARVLHATKLQFDMELQRGCTAAGAVIPAEQVRDPVTKPNSLSMM
jgi:hypothetical protein